MEKLKRVLIVILILSVLFDFGMTLWGQPLAYWQGGTPNEENPIGFFLLLQHPVSFALFSVVWLLFLMLSMRYLVYPFDIIFGTGIVMGHVWGISSWIVSIAPLPILILSPRALDLAAIFIATVFTLDFIVRKTKKG